MSTRAAWVAWSVWALCVVVFALTELLDLTTPNPFPQSDPSWAMSVLRAVLILTYSTIGALVASRRPGNPIGWIFCGAGLFLAGLFLTTAYAEYALYGGNSPVTGAQYSAWLSDQLLVSVVPLLMVLLLLLFPTGRLPSGLLLPEGRLPSRSWQAVMWMAVGGSAMLGLWQITGPGIGTDDPFYVGNPLEIGGTAGNVVYVGGKIGGYLLLVSILFAGVSLIARTVLARGEERQQLKWFTYGAAVTIGGFFVILLLGTGYSEMSELMWTIGSIAIILGFGSFPIATGIAILRYRLYDIDVVINRTLVYGLLTVLLATIYFGGVTATQAVFQQRTGREELPQLAIVASTLVIAALFNPLRRRIQTFIDRRFYRRKYDAAKTLEAFSARLRDETDLDRLGDELVGVVSETMQPKHASLWLHPDPGLKDRKRATIRESGHDE
jgi:hypothetical protein